MVPTVHIVHTIQCKVSTAQCTYGTCITVHPAQYAVHTVQYSVHHRVPVQYKKYINFVEGKNSLWKNMDDR